MFPLSVIRVLARRRQPVVEFIDVDAPERRRAIREAEWQRELDRCSCVLRVSGKRKWPVVSRRPIVTMER